MIRAFTISAIIFGMLSCASSHKATGTGKWIKLFDGKTLDGWTVNENPGTFKVEDGNIVVNGLRGHFILYGVRL